MVTERAIDVGTTVIPCSKDKVQIILAKDSPSSKPFLKTYLILEICVQRFFLFYNSIAGLACCSVFNSGL